MSNLYRRMRGSFSTSLEKPDVDSIEGLVARYFHRTKNRFAFASFNRRHGYGNLRLSAAAFFINRATALSRNAARQLRGSRLNRL